MLNPLFCCTKGSFSLRPPPLPSPDSEPAQGVPGAMPSLPGLRRKGMPPCAPATRSCMACTGVTPRCAASWMLKWPYSTSPFPWSRDTPRAPPNSMPGTRRWRMRRPVRPQLRRVIAELKSTSRAGSYARPGGTRRCQRPGCSEKGVRKGGMPASPLLLSVLAAGGGGKADHEKAAGRGRARRLKMNCLTTPERQEACGRQGRAPTSTGHAYGVLEQALGSLSGVACRRRGVGRGGRKALQAAAATLCGGGSANNRVALGASQVRLARPRTPDPSHGWAEHLCPMYAASPMLKAGLRGTK